MNSLDIVKLHRYFLDKFNISQIPLSAIEVLRNMLMLRRIEEILNCIDIEEQNESLRFLVTKYSNRDPFLAYGILKFIENKI